MPSCIFWSRIHRTMYALWLTFSHCWDWCCTIYTGLSVGFTSMGFGIYDSLIFFLSNDRFHLCNELITYPEESYQLWCIVCGLETSWMRMPLPALGLAKKKW